MRKLEPTFTDIEVQMKETMSVESWVQCCHERLPNNDGAQVGSATRDRKPNVDTCNVANVGSREVQCVL